jgi:TolB-like protein
VFNRNRRVAIVLGLTLGLCLCSAPQRASASAQLTSTVAVFPVENLTGGSIAGEQIQGFLIERLVSAGAQVLRLEALEQFFDRHRVRYTGGIDAPTAEALRLETGAQAVLIASVEQSNTSLPPKFAIVVRLVSIAQVPTVVWADDGAMSGDESPGLLDLGLVTDYETLQTRVLKRVGDSLRSYVRTGHARAPKAASKFRPDTIYRALPLDLGRTYSIAVMPFFNLTDRPNAGDILGLLFIRHLSEFSQFQVIDTGVVRRQLLDARIIMDGGVSLSDADTIASLVDADFVIGGRLLRYDGSSGSGSDVRVEFSTVVIERKTRRLVWSSDSHNEGREDVGFFERGLSKTAHGMATQMVRLTAASMARRDR